MNLCIDQGNSRVKVALFDKSIMSAFFMARYALLLKKRINTSYLDPTCHRFSNPAQISYAFSSFPCCKARKVSASHLKQY